MRTILVTGGAGYIGSACVQSLVLAGDRVVVLDNFSTGQRDKVLNEIVVVEGDVSSQITLEKLCREFNFDAVIHFAGKKSVEESENNPYLYFANNVVGSLNLLKTMEDFKIPRIVFSSTAAVYAPSNDYAKLAESSPIGPISVYGTTKCMVEDMIKSFAQAGKIRNFSILRYFNVAGDVGLNYQEKNSKNVFPVLASKLRNEEVFEIFGADYDTRDGTCVRDYIHINDLISGHLSALKNDVNGVYNLGTGIGCSVKELVDTFNDLSMKKLKIKVSPRRLGDAPVVVADATLAGNILGWHPKYSLRDMIEDTLRVYG